MMLIVGGAGAGKRAYAMRALGLTEADFSADPFDDASAVANLHNWVFAHPGQGEACMPKLLAKRAVLCNEVGCGVVPMDRGEREAREEVGRLCVALASEAEAVVRVVCGIPTVIKGKLP